MTQQKKWLTGMIGDEGTEQFTVTTRVDGHVVRIQKIHDPFIHNTTGVCVSRWQSLKNVFRSEKNRITKIEVHVEGTQAVQRAIMTLDPVQLAREEEEILKAREISRASSVGGQCLEAQ